MTSPSATLAEPTSKPAAKPTADRHFATDHLLSDLKGRSVRGGAVTLGAQGIKFVLQLVSTVVLARLLTPADFGLVAMVTALTGFVAMFKDAGLSMATVQRAHITHAQVSTLFWVNVGLSAALMLVVAACAPAIAWFYGKPELVAITLVTAGTFIFGGLSVQHTALMKRQMRFSALATKDVASMAVGIIAAIVLAFSGAGYWSLVAMPAAAALAGMILAWVLSGWCPGLPKRGCGVRSMLAFGGFLSGSSFLAYVRRNLDNVLIGVLFGPVTLGLYQKAYQLILLPIQQVNGPISSAVLPALSRLQHQPERYRSFYSTAMLMITSVTMPAIVFMAICAENIIIIVLGEQWREAVPIFVALLPAAFAGTLNIAGGWVYVSTGRTDRQFLANVVVAVLVSAGMLAGIPWGPAGIATGFSLTFVIGLAFLIYYAIQTSPLRMRDLLSAIVVPTVASLAAGSGLMAIKSSNIASPSRLTESLLLAILFGILYVTFWLVLPGGPNRLSTVKSISTSLLYRSTTA